MIVKANNSVPQKVTFIDFNGVKVESIYVLMYKGPLPLKEFYVIIANSQQDTMLEKAIGVKYSINTVKRMNRQVKDQEKIF